MKTITYNRETHTLEEWIKFLKLAEENHQYTGNDILVDFAKELIFNGKITNENLYKAYSLWNLNEHLMPPAVFAKRIAIVFKNHRPDLQRFKTNKVRGWQTIVKAGDGDTTIMC